MSATEEQSQESLEPEQPADSSASMDPELVRQLGQRAADDGMDLVGPDGLLQQVTKQVLEAGLEVDSSEHLGYNKHEVTGRNGANSRNGTRSKTVTAPGSAPSSPRCPATGTARSRRRPCVSDNGGCTGSMRWCCHWPLRA